MLVLNQCQNPIPITMYIRIYYVPVQLPFFMYMAGSSFLVGYP